MLSQYGNPSVKIRTPITRPPTNNKASNLPIDKAQKAVPGQKPPKINPAPIIAPPTIADHKKVGLT